MDNYIVSAFGRPVCKLFCDVFDKPDIMAISFLSSCFLNPFYQSSISEYFCIFPTL